MPPEEEGGLHQLALSNQTKKESEPVVPSASPKVLESLPPHISEGEESEGKERTGERGHSTLEVGPRWERWSSSLRRSFQNNPPPATKKQRKTSDKAEKEN